MNTANIINKQQVVCGIIREMNQVIFIQLILNLLNISIARNTYNVGNGEDGYDPNKVSKNETKIIISLKHLSNFWRTLNIQSIHCEIELILTWSKKLCFS